MEEGDRRSREEGSCRYTMQPSRIYNEDILLCIDIDPQSLVEMKTATGHNDRPLTRLDSIKQSILLFVHSKLTINPDHRFAFATLSTTVSWLKKDFSSDVGSTLTTMRGLSVRSPTLTRDRA